MKEAIEVYGPNYGDTVWEAFAKISAMAQETGKTFKFDCNDRQATIGPETDIELLTRDNFLADGKQKIVKGRYVYPDIGPLTQPEFDAATQSAFDERWQNAFKVDQKYYGKGNGGMMIRLMWQHTTGGKAGLPCPCAGDPVTSLGQVEPNVAAILLLMASKQAA